MTSLNSANQNIGPVMGRDARKDRMRLKILEIGYSFCIRKKVVPKYSTIIKN